MYYLICCYKDSNILSFLQAFKKKILSEMQFFLMKVGVPKDTPTTASNHKTPRANKRILEVGTAVKR